MKFVAITNIKSSSNAHSAHCKMNFKFINRTSFIRKIGYVFNLHNVGVTEHL